MSISSRDRPTSPHLTIYRPQISSVLSISHRISGLALYGGTLLLVLWLWSAAYKVNAFHTIHEFMGSIPGLILLLGWTLAFYYHLANGIRHLWWDTGRGLSLPDMHRSGWAVIVFTLAMTAGTWAYILQ